MTIGDKILNLRKGRGWSQEELADRVGVTRQAVSRWESNSAKPDADKIVALCDLFGVTADYLLRGGTTAQEAVLGASLSHRKMAGILMILGGFTVLMILVVISAVKSEVFTEFIDDYGLVWLMFLIVNSILVGLWLLLEERIKRMQWWRMCHDIFQDIRDAWMN